MRSEKLKKVKFAIFISFLISLFSFFFSCVGMATSAEEYFSIGMAYFDIGRFDEAERWLNRARQSDRTMVASTYNLGRLAFERQRYDEAAEYFEDILKSDSDNVFALRAAAYTRIAMGDINTANRHYSRLLQLVPESADDGYNHALVLFAMGRFGETEAVLERFPFALADNRDALLLYARSQAALNKVESIDSFAAWLVVHSDPKVRYEYAQVLEHHEFYARALEEYRLALSETPAASVDPERHDIRFAIARVLLIADDTSTEGITELEAAVNDGFDNIEALEKLMNDERIGTTNINSIRYIISNMPKT
jgi:tetratricopeptide (TPR) repeat protein